MTTDSRVTTDFRMPAASKWRAPRAMADGGGGTIIATAEVSMPLERVFRALTTSADYGIPFTRKANPLETSGATAPKALLLDRSVQLAPLNSHTRGANAEPAYCAT